MERIIYDVYEKGGCPYKHEIPVSVNKMYSYLYQKGILKEISFIYKDFKEVMFFALDVKDLLKYKSEMEKIDTFNAALACNIIFDKEISPCTTTGAIQLMYSMKTYRSDSIGCVSSSWEIDLSSSLENKATRKLYEVYKEKGTREAVLHAFETRKWKGLTLDELYY